MFSKISSLLSVDRINLALQATTKTESLREVASLMKDMNCIKDFEAFFRDVLERERVSNTALGHDVALPHARTDQCSEIIIAVGRSPTGIDFEAKDGQPVRLVFLIGTPKSMVTEYLRLVGNLARLLRQNDLRENLLEADSPEAFVKLIEAAEG
jgi:mannitol/fructose-specific phosphotransferase system IIA component (Ntr-type)